MSARVPPESIASDREPLAAVSSLPRATLKGYQRRRTLSTLLTDTLSQGIFLLSISVAVGGAGLTLYRNGLLALGGVALALSVSTLLAYLLLTARAVKRDKAIQYWHDRNDLRLQLRRGNAHQALLTAALWRVHQLDRGDVEDVSSKLGALIADVHRVLATSHDQSAVLLALQQGDTYRILHSRADPGGCWGHITPGKHCPVIGPVKQTLDGLSAYNQSFELETDSGKILIAALSETPFSESDEELFDHVKLCLSLVASRWRQTSVPLSRSLEAVSG